MNFPPTPEQEAILASVASGDNVHVEALAGCAKTTTIEMCVRALPPGHKTLILAFNVKIKKEIEAKLKDLPNVKVQTANGLGAGVLYAARIRGTLDSDKIYKLSKEVGLRGDDLADCMQLVRSARMAGVIPTGLVGTPLLADTSENWTALALDADIDPILAVPAKEILLKSTKLALTGTIDFDDQIYLSALMLGGFPRYDTIFVDEAQDLSPLNHAQVRKFGKAPQLVVVGDSHQAIYAWRGADSNSMSNIRDLREHWTNRKLSVTFRCPKSVVARQQEFVPDFKAGPNNLEGEVRGLANWTPEPGSAILCRNNAPIIKTAFRLLRRGIPAQVLGTDIGRSLKRLYNKLSNHGALSRDEVFDKGEALKIADPKKADQVDSLLALLEGARDIESGIRALTSGGGIQLSTGHRAKGLEWNTVYHLEPGLIPSQWARTEEEFQQEDNLRYVIETRTKDKLFFVSTQGLQ